MATKSRKNEQVVKTYTVLSPLRVGDDDLYEEGDSIEMNAVEATELIAAGVLQERKEKIAPTADADIA